MMIRSALYRQYLKDRKFTPDRLARFRVGRSAIEPLVAKPIKDCHLLSTVDVQLFKDEIKESDWSDLRAKQIEKQKHTLFIPLRRVIDDGTRTFPYHGQEQEEVLASQYPNTMAWLNNFAKTVGKGSLERAMFVSLLPKSVVYPHSDFGLYYLIRDRYHVVIDSDSSIMHWPDGNPGEYLWKEGEVWWFSSGLTHFSRNDSDKGRVHLIFDVLPETNQYLKEEMKQFILNCK